MKNDRWKIENIQLLYYWIFVIILIMPNLYLSYLESKPISTLTPYIFIPFALYMLLISVTKKPGFMIFVALPSIIAGAFQLVLIKLSKSTAIGVDMFTNIYTTSSSEAGDVLKTLTETLLLIVAVYGGALALGVVSIKTKAMLHSQTRKKLRVVALSLLVFGGSVSFVPYSTSPEYRIDRDVFPINVLTNFGISIDKWIESSKYPETSKNFKYNSYKAANNVGREVYLLIVGESSRADKWSLYGYERETNPQLTKIKNNLIIYKDAVTQSNTTHKSTALIMSSADAANFNRAYETKSVVSAFKEAGFKTLFISNQGANGTFMDFYASEADVRIDMPMRSDDKGEYMDYDGKMLECLKEHLTQTTDDIFIVIHAYGSHLQYVDRYPKAFEKFKPARSNVADVSEKEYINNAYDNTILYTDSFINGAISIIDSLDVCSGVIYISDHGEDLFDDYRERFLHSSPTLTYYQLHIPYLIWFSDSYKNLHKEKYSAALNNQNKSVSSNSVFHTLLDMASIATVHTTQTKSIINNRYTEQERLFLDDLYRTRLFYDTGLDSIDFRLMQRYGVKCGKINNN